MKMLRYYFEHLKISERKMIYLIVIVLCLAITFFVQQSRYKSINKSKLEQVEINEKYRNISQEVGGIKEMIGAIEAQLNEQKVQLEKEKIRYEEQADNYKVDRIITSSEEMKKVVASLFKNNPNITLVSFKSSESKKITSQDVIDSQRKSTKSKMETKLEGYYERGTNLFNEEELDLNSPLSAGIFSELIYKHSGVLQVQGRFVDLYQYVKELEKNMPTVTWDSGDVEVKIYPLIVISLNFSIYNFDPQWL